MDILEHNRIAWDKQVEGKNRWTIPVSTEETEAARMGRWEIVLTPNIPIPKEWFPPLENADVLCLASGGGQQGPILAAAGARVTVLDYSTNQLAQDRSVAERDSLEIKTIQGDMADLNMLDDRTFDLIVHPVSNTFVPDVRPVWAEAFRVLRSGGALLSGFTNPLAYLFDQELTENEGTLRVVYSIPYSDVGNLPQEKMEKCIEAKSPLEYSHTLDDQIGGQIEGGFLIAGFYEDRSSEDEDDLLSEYIPIFIATRAIKP